MDISDIMNGAHDRPHLAKSIERVARVKFSIFLLWLISKKAVHGYDIIKALKSEPAMSEMAASRIYPILAELSGRGLISCRRVMQGKRAKKLYRLTPQGRSRLGQAKTYIRSNRMMVAFMEDMLK
jgi:DNA-binding PadR family transcriptional regulator